MMSSLPVVRHLRLGGGGGIGTAVCHVLAKMGAKFAAACRTLAKASATAQALKASGHDAFSTSFDGVSVAETKRAVDEAAAHFGRLDILVDCMGTLRQEQKAEGQTEKGDVSIVGRGAAYDPSFSRSNCLRNGRLTRST